MRRYWDLAFGRETNDLEWSRRCLLRHNRAACRWKGSADRLSRAWRRQRPIAQGKILLIICFRYDRRQAFEQVLGCFVRERLGRRYFFWRFLWFCFFLSSV